MTCQPPPSREETPLEPSAANGALPVAAPIREMAPAEPIYDGEVVDDLPGATRRAVIRRFLNWWQRCPCVPVALKSRPALRSYGRQGKGRLVVPEQIDPALWEWPDVQPVLSGHDVGALYRMTTLVSTAARCATAVDLDYCM
jgi:hypothetical protein